MSPEPFDPSCQVPAGLEKRKGLWRRECDVLTMSHVLHRGITNKSSLLSRLNHGRRRWDIRLPCELPKVDENATFRRRNRTGSACQSLTFRDSVIKGKER